MRKTLDRFSLGFPILFLKQYPYAWIGFVGLWPQSPSNAMLFLVVVLMVLGMLFALKIFQPGKSHVPEQIF